MATKLQTFAFLLARPHYYPELWRRIRRAVGLAALPPQPCRGRTIAERWASQKAICLSEAVRKITGEDQRSLAEIHPTEIAQATERVRSCPVRMGGGSAIDLLYHLSRHIRARKIVETGVAYGLSSLAFLLAAEETDGHLYSVDMPYPGRGNTPFVGCAVPEHLHERWTLLRYPDFIGLPKILRRCPSVDLFHYDSDKSYEGRAWAYRRAWEALRPGGLFISDDIGDNTAFRDFVRQRRVPFLVVAAQPSGNSRERFLGILTKPS